MVRGLLVLLAIAGLCSVECGGSVSLKEWRQLSRVGDIWSDCSKPGDPAKINNVTIVPDPPVIGKEVTITASLTSNEVVTGGKVDIKITYNFIPFTKTYDLCDLTKKINYTCPLPKGTINVSVPAKIPAIAPKGDYQGHVTASDQNGQELGCIDLKLTLK